MDIQSIINSVTESVKDAPEKVKEFLSDPGAGIKSITGEDLDAGSIAEVAKGVIEKIKDGGGDVAEKLEGILGDKLDESPIGDAIGAIGDKLGGIFGKGDKE